ncbi:MAG: copper resistance protein CopC, partial [Chloroflexi bacterium]|nr:copper resistance protein CopC [Chloroflexota bacterium]
MTRVFAYRRVGFAVVALVAMAAIFLLSPSRAAFAHANLASADPAPNSVLNEPPARVVITFTEPLEAQFSAIEALNAQGQRVDNGDSIVDANDPLVMSVTLQEGLANGTYTVAWRNVSTVDGHSIRGAFVFSVGEPIAPGVGGEPDEGHILQSQAEPFLRWLVLLSAAAVIGGISFRLLVSDPILLRRDSRASARRIGERIASRTKRLVWTALALFLAASAGQLVIQASRLFEESVLGSIGSPLWAVLTDTDWGELWLWRVALALAMAAAIGLAAMSERRVNGGESARLHSLLSVLALALGLGTLLTLSLVSHAAATPGIRAQALLNDYLHIVAVSVWVGGLFQLALGLPLIMRALQGRERREVLAAITPRFSLVAGFAVAVLVVTGLFSAWAQVTVFPALVVPYGITLVVKVALVAAILALAAANLLWVRPRLRGSDSSARWLRRFVAGEAVIAVLVLLSVGYLTAIEPARQVASRQGIGVPDSLTFQDTSEGAEIGLEIEPGSVGPNTLTVSLRDALGRPIENATDVRVRLSYLDADLGEEPVPAENVGGGRYVL